MRFEMPFAVWCTTCKPHETLIGQGVRFNAEKKKVGNYYSTPIYSFRMKHTQCGGWIEIRTDPKNTAYVVVEGGRKRETGLEAEDAEILGRFGAKKEDGKGGDPFAKLEGKVEDKRTFDSENRRIWELKKRQDRDWEDPYEKSRKLRRRFRVERKGLEGAEREREKLKEKMSLGIELVDEVEEDRVRAGMVDFGAGDASDASRAARARPLFEPKTPPAATESRRTGKVGHGKRAGDLLAQRKATLRNELAGNTRAVVDPFLNNGGAWQTEAKRRKPANKAVSGDKTDIQSDEKNRADVAGDAAPPTALADQKPAALVAYESDTE